MSRKTFTPVFIFFTLLLSYAHHSHAQVILNDDFSNGLQGWSYYFQWGCSCPANCSPYTCQTYYSLSLDTTTGAGKPSAHVSGDYPGQPSATWNSSFNCNAGIEKTITLPAIGACDSVYLTFDYRAKSTVSTSSITNALFRVFDSTTNTLLDGVFLVAGGTLDTGWKLYSRNLSSKLAGVTHLKILLFTSDGWSQNWHKEVWFDNVKVEIKQGGKPTAGNIMAVRDTICEGTPASLSLSGNSTGDIQWQSKSGSASFTNISGATSNTYLNSLTGDTYFRAYVNNGGCSDTTLSHLIVVRPNPTADFTYTISGMDVTFNSSGSSGDVAYYNWDFGDGIYSIDANPIHSYQGDGIKNVCLTVFNGSNCSYTLCLDINLSPNRIDAIEGVKWNIYPAPFSDDFFIDGGAGNYKITGIEIYNLLGKRLLNKSEVNIKGGAIRINASGLANGFYLLKIKTPQQEFIRPLVKQ